MTTRRKLLHALGVLLPVVSGCFSESDDSPERFTYVEMRIYDSDPENATIIESSGDALEGVVVFQELLETAERDYPDEMEEARSVYHDQKYKVEEYSLGEYADSEIEAAMRVFQDLPRSEPDEFPRGVYIEHDEHTIQAIPIIED